MTPGYPVGRAQAACWCLQCKSHPGIDGRLRTCPEKWASWMTKEKEAKERGEEDEE